MKFSGLRNLSWRMLLTSSVLLAQVRESPDIPESHAVTDNTEEKLHLAAPFRSVLLLGFLTASSILASGYHDCHVLACLTFLVQRSQLMPISRTLVPDYHSSPRSSFFKIRIIQLPPALSAPFLGRSFLFACSTRRPEPYSYSFFPFFPAFCSSTRLSRGETRWTSTDRGKPGPTTRVKSVQTRNFASKMSPRRRNYHGDQGIGEWQQRVAAIESNNSVTITTNDDDVNDAVSTTSTTKTRTRTATAVQQKAQQGS